MAIRKLKLWDDPILRKISKKVTVIDKNVKVLLDDMVDTLHAMPNAVALAACQVGVLQRLVVIDTGIEILKLINPVIIEQRGTQEYVESCLSFPNVFGITRRPQKVIVEYLNENGKNLIITGEYKMAKCLCHEIDHLDGKVFIDKVIKYIETPKKRYR